MSLIDWSSPDEMLGLLVEYVDDEAVASQDDADRARFLTELSRALVATAEQDFASVEQIEVALREVHDSQPREFAHDSVLIHLEACMEEIHRIQRY
jgi:hypothetical protein